MDSKYDLKKLVSISGMEDFKKVVDEWDNIALNTKKIGYKGNIILPDYFCVAKPGANISNLVASMSDYLEQQNLMIFSSDIKYCRFYLDYNNNPELFSAFGRLYDVFENQLSKYGRSFSGILLIDITEWIYHDALNDTRFTKFIDYISKKDDDTIVLFISNCQKDELNKKAEIVLASSFRIRRITLSETTKEELMTILKEDIEKEGLILSNEACELIKETLAQIPKIPGFEGIRTIDQLAKDIIYEKFVSNDFHDLVITDKDVERFKVDGEWINQFKKVKENSIGFIKVYKNE